MSRGVGDEGEEVEVPAMLFEVEVETETSPADVDESINGMSKYLLSSRPPPKLPENRMTPPFNTAQGFAEWLLEVMDISSYEVIHFLIYRYYLKPNLKRMKTLVAFAKCSFQNVRRLYYLEGLFSIATTTKQKYYTERVYRKQLQMYWKHGF